jgi:uncharacterized protein
MTEDVGFHQGELAVQERAGVRGLAARLAGMLDPPDLTGGAAKFLGARTFAVITARDGAGRLWTSPLAGSPGFLDAADETLVVHAAPTTGDPLHGLAVDQPVGLLAIEFATRRRMRVNGTVVEAGADRLRIAVHEAYGNCPQYIHERRLTVTKADVADPPRPAKLRSALERADIDLIQGADTFFLGTTHPVRGLDCSHRGGPPGFVRVGVSELWWPDYPGNNMFNSFGNLAVDDTAALLFVDFTTGRTLHLSGRARLEWTASGAPGDDGGTGRRVHFRPVHVTDGPPAPVRSIAPAAS